MDVVIGALATVIAVLIASMTSFRYAVRQDQQRWLLERRSELYVDLLVEANAELIWAMRVLTGEEIASIRAEIPSAGRLPEDRFPEFPDTRLDPLERARLGARMAAYGSDEVNSLFGKIGLGVGLPSRSGDPVQSKWQVQKAFDALEAQIRMEFRANQTPIASPESRSE